MKDKLPENLNALRGTRKLFRGPQKDSGLQFENHWSNIIHFQPKKYLRFIKSRLLLLQCAWQYKILYTYILVRRQQRDISVFESSCHLPMHLFTKHDGGFTLTLFNAERHAGKLKIPIFIVFGLIRLGIEPTFTVSTADALSIQPFFFRVYCFETISIRPPHKLNCLLQKLNFWISSKT